MSWHTVAMIYQRKYVNGPELRVACLLITSQLQELIAIISALLGGEVGPEDRDLLEDDMESFTVRRESLQMRLRER